MLRLGLGSLLLLGLIASSLATPAHRFHLGTQISNNDVSSLSGFVSNRPEFVRDLGLRRKETIENFEKGIIAAARRKAEEAAAMKKAQEELERQKAEAARIRAEEEAKEAARIKAEEEAIKKAEVERTFTDLSKRQSTIIEENEVADFENFNTFSPRRTGTSGTFTDLGKKKNVIIEKIKNADFENIRPFSFRYPGTFTDLDKSQNEISEEIKKIDFKTPKTFSPRRKGFVAVKSLGPFGAEIINPLNHPLKIDTVRTLCPGCTVNEKTFDCSCPAPRDTVKTICPSCIQTDKTFNHIQADNIRNLNHRHTNIVNQLDHSHTETVKTFNPYRTGFVTFKKSVIPFDQQNEIGTIQTLDPYVFETEAIIPFASRHLIDPISSHTPSYSSISGTTIRKAV